MNLSDNFDALESPAKIIQDALETARSHLSMDVAYLSEICPDFATIQNVATANADEYVQPGKRIALGDMFCRQIANGDLPDVVIDTHANPRTRNLTFVKDAGIGAFVMVPILQSDGNLYGMFCCFSHKARPDIVQRDIDTVLMFAKLTNRTLNQHFDAQHEIFTLTDRLNHIIRDDALSIHLQPIVSLSDGRPMAAEALSRFSLVSSRGPEWWFQQAQRTDMQIELEVTAISKALTFLQSLPEKTYLTVNASPLTVSSPMFMEAIRDVPKDRLLVELTEREVIQETPQLMRSLAILREMRIGIAIDDVGAGYSGLSTIVSLKPNVLKLDRSLVSQIQDCTVKQSLTKAMVHFSAEMNAFLVAEGVETAAEDAILNSLGVRLGQGYYYARPGDAESIARQMRILRSSSTLHSVS